MQTTQQFITSIKLKELQRQRALLSEAYQNIQQEVQTTQLPLEKLRVLHKGLSKLQFAGQHLHPSIENLTILLEQNLSFSSHTIQLWLDKLTKELQQGLLRTEMVCVFGTLLEEWIQAKPTAKTLEQMAEEAHQNLWANTAQVAPLPNRFQEFLDEVFALFSTEIDLKESLEDIHELATQHELQPILENITANAYLPAQIRKEAKEAIHNQTLLKELTDTITILNADFTSWHWGKNTTTRSVWTRNKWRLYLNENLATLCFLEMIGNRYIISTELDNEKAQIRQERLQRLLEINAPQVIIENEQRILNETISEEGLLLYRYPNDLDKLANAEEECVVNLRKTNHINVRALSPTGHEAGEHSYLQTTNQAITLLHAEIQLHKATQPDKPLFISKLDIQNFYAGIPKEVSLYLLKKLGFPENQQDFFSRYLSPNLIKGQQTTVMQKGVPMEHNLSALLAEWLMRLMETYVSSKVNLRIIRKVDDIFLLSHQEEDLIKARAYITTFCQQCGLALNDNKAGNIVIGPGTFSQLPLSPIQAGILELNEQGEWQLNESTFKLHQEQTRLRLESATSIFTAVQVYNANVRYLIHMLYLNVHMGSQHREAAEQCILQFHEHLFGDQGGIIEHLTQRIQKLYGPLPNNMQIPIAWFYWPLTAGGLGVQNPVLTASLYAKTIQGEKYHPKPTQQSESWDTQDNDWTRYYNDLSRSIEIQEPHKDQVLDSLIRDFINRGNEISGGNQYSLSPYWQWVLFIYGSEILDSMGTFRYLITELVPLQLIFNQLNEDASL
ncbi:MAG TPA: hypothetical protein DCS93_23710 [Microscillaceae bacterium]|nr:hypothetical protein [Microscillaceae bacterium]